MAKTNQAPEEKKQFYSDGTLKDLTFVKDGKVEGVYTSYFQNGQIMAQLHFTRGKKNGPAMTYYENGQIREKADFFNDCLEGQYVS
jgi:uncharacterized protein